MEEPFLLTMTMKREALYPMIFSIWKFYFEAKNCQQDFYSKQCHCKREGLYLRWVFLFLLNWAPAGDEDIEEVQVVVPGLLRASASADGG